MKSSKEVGLLYRALAVSTGVPVMQAIVEAERDHLTGQRYAHNTEVDRWGSEVGYVIVGRQNVRVKRPRLRDKQKSVRVTWTDPHLRQRRISATG